MPTEDPVVDVTIDSFSPAAPVPGQAVTITGRITNTSTATFNEPQALSCIEPKRMTTRAELASIDIEADEPVKDRNKCEGLTNADSTTWQQVAPSLAPKASVPFKLVVPWDEWEISDEPGVYTVGVRFRGNITEKDRTTGGLSLTLMPVTDPKASPRTVNAAMVVPLRHRPTVLSGTTFANESLAESMAPTGQLGRLLELGSKQKVTWLVDPAMLDEARVIQTGNYKILGADGQSKPGNGQKIVSTWLKAFELSHHQGNQVVLLPYGDPDVAGLLGAGDPLKGLVGSSRSFTEAYNLGGPNPTFDPGLWLENGAANSANLAQATTGFPGARTTDLTLVNSSAWPAADRPDLSSPLYSVSTPQGPVKSVNTIVSDDSLIAGGPDPATASQPLQLRQRFAAETALLAATGKGPATVVVAPPRDSGSAETTTAALLQGLTLPWIKTIDLHQVSDLTARPAKPITQKPAAILPEGQLDQLNNLSQAGQTYRSLLAEPNVVDEDLKRAQVRLSSSSWAGFPDEAQRFGTYQQTQTANQLAKVHLVNSALEDGQRKEIKVNLSGSKGTFPLTVQNELDYSVRVRIVVTSANRADLRIATLPTRLLAAKQKATFQINASAEQNGLIRANAQVVSAEGLPVGKSHELLIEAAQYGSVGWILVGAACALLFGTSAVRIYRRIRSERRNGSTPGPESDPLHPAPLVITADHEADGPADQPDGVQGDGLESSNGHADVGGSLKEGVGTKDG